MTQTGRKILFGICLVLVAVGSARTAFGLVRISNMNDFNFGSWSGVGNLSATDGVCIYDNGGATTYRLRFRGSGTSFAFTMANGAATLPYSVEYRDATGVYTTMTANSTTTFSTANGTSTTCGGGTNGTIRITVLETNLLAQSPGTFSGTLTVRLQP